LHILWDLFNYVTVILVTIYLVVIEMLLDYTRLSFKIFSRSALVSNPGYATACDPRAGGARDADPWRSLPDAPPALPAFSPTEVIKPSPFPPKCHALPFKFEDAGHVDCCGRNVSENESDHLMYVLLVVSIW